MKPKYKIGQLVIYPTYSDYDYGRIRKIIIEDRVIKYGIDNAQDDKLFEESSLNTNPCDWINSIIDRASMQIKLIIESRDNKIKSIKEVFKLK